MGRDLSIWKRLLFSGRTPDEIEAAIRNVRQILVKQEGVPLRMTVFYNSQGYAVPVFEMALGIHLKSRYEGKRKKNLPPTIRDVLRGMVG